MRPRLLAVGAAVSAALLIAGPGASLGSALEDDGSIAAGSASASSLNATYSDETTIIEGATLPPPNVNIGFSSGDIDRAGSSVALAAVAYSPYVDLPPAVNALAPAGTPHIDFEPVLSRARATVIGQPPKDSTASLTTPTDLVEVGTAEAHLSKGPEVNAFSTLNRLEPAPATHIKWAVSRIKIAKVDGNAVTEATTILRSVSIAGLLTFDSVTITAKSTADGGAGDAIGSVLIEGGSIGGVPIALTETGIRVGDNVAPVALAGLEDTLKQAGIELIGPGALSLEPGGERSVSVATGPQITYTAPQGQTVQLTLGRAIASSTRLAGFSLPPLPDAPSVVAPPAFVPPTDVGGSVFTPPTSTVALPPQSGPGVVDLSRLVLNDAKSVDAFAALYGALAVGAMLVLAGVVLPRRRSLLEERLR